MLRDHPLCEYFKNLAKDVAEGYNFVNRKYVKSVQAREANWLDDETQGRHVRAKYKTIHSGVNFEHPNFNSGEEEAKYYDYPEALLICEVIIAAIKDLTLPAEHKDYKSAFKFFTQEDFIPTCDLIGIDPVWLMDKIAEFHLGPVTKDYDFRARKRL